ncbi:MAG: hypothetical protein GY861_03280 [bacterium]|nr:hypothetical protein [bacterium]
MKISKPSHKGILQGCFLTAPSLNRNQQIFVSQKSFPLEKLGDAGTAYKKLLSDADKKTNKFSEKQIEFTPGEVVILKEVFDEKSKRTEHGFTPTSAESVLEIKDLFEGKEKV